MHLIIPKNYNPVLNLRDTEIAIKLVKDFFETELARALNLTRVSAPIMVTPGSGLNDNLNGVERPVSFDVLETGETAEGNADFFLGGKHISGYWKRDSMTSRTVYYDASGKEIALLRGRTLIVIFPDDAASKRSVSYE